MHDRKKNGATESVSGPVIRCAIYTRKSTDEGLQQEFNSLDAQREAAEAFIASQRHDGWQLVPDRYDDGGFSGGDMERPALKRLLVDIEARKIDCVVVYKVDRLSRSLLDFARMVELFDRHGVSFVSVTQQFNTTTSLGRLTLNILLSFAQFEREIISERTRDKMSAARRKGKWVGGVPMLGYDVDPKGGKLVVNEEEAMKVRAAFGLYLEQRALMPVVQELNRRGWGTKHWVTKNGREQAGRPFTKNGLFRLFTNVIYTGRVNHKGTIYSGEHPPIVELTVWEQVNSQLRHNGVTGGREVRNKYGALLRGLLYCEPCRAAMVHTYTVKNSRRYRYYVCLSAQQRGWSTCPSKSLPAADIEESVVERIRVLGKHPQVLAETVRRAREEADSRGRELQAGIEAADKELSRLNRELIKVVGTDGNGIRVDRIADLQEKIGAVERRLSDIQNELQALPGSAIQEEELAQALAAFDPVWKSLSTVDQSRFLKAVIERIGYDGETGRVAVSFRSSALKGVCNGLE